ncbi:unnamed protein product [Anisakis simplex]|uniref:GH26238p2 (inferred by orthology to a D. melanogaster protein) n=1 Tax=Anisakis simplex TaxID=6269 RepID=A0A0M3JV88_ANISI|nr:unnamed protein product [Anisakis simplex]
MSTKEVLVNGDKVMFHHEFSYGTSAVRGTKRLTSSTVAYWEIHVTNSYLFGTSIMFGVGNAHAQCSWTHRFDNMLGCDKNSYGLSYFGDIFHNGININFCEPFTTASVVALLFNGPDATLSYFVDGIPLGVAFSNIDLSTTLYPMISRAGEFCSMATDKVGHRRTCD